MEMLVLLLSEPEVPVTVTVAEAVNMRVEVVLPFAAEVTGLLENTTVTPLARPVALSVVAELKLF